MHCDAHILVALAESVSCEPHALRLHTAFQGLRHLHAPKSGLAYQLHKLTYRPREMLKPGPILCPLAECSRRAPYSTPRQTTRVGTLKRKAIEKQMFYLQSSPTAEIPKEEDTLE